MQTEDKDEYQNTKEYTTLPSLTPERRKKKPLTPLPHRQIPRSLFVEEEGTTFPAPQTLPLACKTPHH